jgi:hypothetical protein
MKYLLSTTRNENTQFYITGYVLYSILSVVNAAYFTKILKLKDKKFHLMMFLLL